MLLVSLMEELLSTLESNQEYRSFVMDGQCVLVEDYLEVRPNDLERVKRHIRDGRISIGPWYTLPDLYPVDGESLVRNLLKGIRISDSFGGHLPVAYESFGWGQTAQFPQIYKGFGFDIVIVAKNVSRQRAPDCEFIWAGPDGTRILATRLGQHGRANFFMNAYLKIMNGMSYLSDEYRLRWDDAGVMYHTADGYGSHSDYFQLGTTEEYHPEFVKESIQTAWDAMNDTLVKNHRILMDGSDSSTSQPWLPRILHEANDVFEDITFVHSRLEEYTEIIKDHLMESDLTIVQGELRDGPASACSANALMIRPALKRQNRLAQNMLYRSAEPLSVISAMVGAEYNRTFLDIAQKYLLLSHPHDSINGVTQDKTVQDVLYMLSQMQEIGNVVSNDACSGLIRRIDTSMFDPKDILMVVVNPSPFNRSEIVRAYIDTPQEYNIWDFDIVDSQGKVMPIQEIARVETTVPVNDLHARPWPFYADRHEVLLHTGEVPAGGYCVLRVVPGRTFNRKTVF